MHELSQSLDDIDIFACPRYDQLGTLMQAVVQNFQALQHVSPILALVVEALIEHVHNFVEVGRAVATKLLVSACRGK